MKKTLIALSLVVTLMQTNLISQDWNQWLGPNRDSVWNDSNIITSFPEDGLKAKWKVPVAAGFSGPAVADDRVFLTDYVLQDGDNRFDPGKRSTLKGVERVHCLNVNTGETIWTHEYEQNYNISYALGPRATPTVDGDHVYTLGAEGQLICFQVKDGSVVWQRDLKKDYNVKEAPIWGYAAHPLVHGDTIYCMVGGEGSIAVALDKNTGEEKWKALSAIHAGYCPPTMINAGGTDQLLIWHPESVNSLNPQTGEVYWSVEVKPAYEMSIVAPIMYENHLLVTGLQGSSVLLELDSEKPAVTEVWRGKGLQPDHNPPIIHDGYLYGVDVKGHLRCIELKSGERVWESMATCPGGRPASSTTGFVVRNGKHFYITTEQGELIIANLTPKGYEELGRMKMLEPTAENWGRKIVGATQLSQTNACSHVTTKNWFAIH